MSTFVCGGHRFVKKMEFLVTRGFKKKKLPPKVAKKKYRPTPKSSIEKVIFEDKKTTPTSAGKKKPFTHLMSKKMYKLHFLQYLQNLGEILG